MRRFTVEQRRARLVRRHHLASPAGSCAEAAEAVIGVHSSDAASAVLALRARVAGFRAPDAERALYEQRTLARVLGMRRTMFVVPTALVPVVHAACARALAPRERRRTQRLLSDAGISDDAETWLAEVEAATLAALEARGEATAGELAADVPALRLQIPFGQGRKWAGSMGVSTRVLFLLATDGRVVRARPRGSWTSTQYRWAPLESWLGIDVDALATEEAAVELARRYLRAFGPATVDDLRWWTGWTVATTRRVLSRLDVAEVDLSGTPGIALADDLAPPTDDQPPRVALLPALDPTVMGWKQRDWYLGDHREALFDRNGNAGPTVWWDGRVVGGWAQRGDGEIAVRLLSDVGADAGAAVAAAAEDLGRWLGPVRFVPRFRTPLERELSA